MMKGSGSRSRSRSVQNNDGSGSGRPKNVRIRIRIHNTAHHYITEQKVHWQTGALATCHASPFVTNIIFTSKTFTATGIPVSRPEMLSDGEKSSSTRSETPQASTHITLIKKKIKFSSYIRKFRMEQLQSHVWLPASSYVVKYLRVSSYRRKPFFMYDFATDSLWISLYMRKIWFLFYQCTVKPCLFFDSKWRRNNLEKLVSFIHF